MAGFESCEFDWLELGKKKLRDLWQQLLRDEKKFSPVTSADYLRALSDVSPQKGLAERLMATCEEMLDSLKNQQTLDVYPTW